MNRDIACPSCDGVINSEEFGRQDMHSGPWYKYRDSKLSCPHCGIGLQYGVITKVIIIIIGSMFLVLAILAVLEVIPVIAMLMFPPIAGFIFWEKRKLCIYKH